MTSRTTSATRRPAEIVREYLRGERKAMVKVKRLRTIDAVIVGWRPGKEENTVGSLILGLYDTDGDGWANIPGYDRWTFRPRLFWEGAGGAKGYLTVGALAEQLTG